MLNDTAIIHHLDIPLPYELHVGRGQFLHLRGWAFSPAFATQWAHLDVGGEPVLLGMHSMPRRDVIRQMYPDHDKNGYSLNSGFWCTTPVAEHWIGQSLPVSLVLGGGGKVAKVELGTVEFNKNFKDVPLPYKWLGNGPKVAICMAAYRPNSRMFRRQLDSIRGQSFTNWMCVITDDSASAQHSEEIERIVGDDTRFIVIKNEANLGFYHNFEKAIGLAPPDADFIALSDQDDRWDMDKLEALVSAFKHETSLVYSDCRLTDEAGNILSPTYWSTRRNNYDNLSTLAIANTVTGAASMFRAAIRPKILPFPQREGDAYHDHWIALVARANGPIRYIERPLYDYVQHENNVIGHSGNQRYPGITSFARQVARHANQPTRMLSTASEVLSVAITQYQFLLRVSLMARTILYRQDRFYLKQDRRTFVKLARYSDSKWVPLAEKTLSMIQRRPSLNLEGHFLYSAWGARAARLYYRLRGVKRYRTALDHPASALPPTPLESSSATSQSHPAVDGILHAIAPLTPDLDTTEPQRLNLLMARIDFRYVYGGYIGMFNLAARLAKAGRRVRIVLLEEGDYDLAQWRTQIAKYPGLEDLFDRVEVVYRFHRDKPLPMNPQDGFIATNGWSAHVAHSTLKRLNREGFVFMAQEFEPLFLPSGTIHALFLQSYDLPQFTYFSTPLLRDYFRSKRLGIYRNGDTRAAQENCAVFKNAILPFDMDLQKIREAEKRIVFYARPEQHAARNLFELGYMALQALVAASDLRGWSFHGIGHLGGQSSLPLGAGAELKMLPKTGLGEYKDMLVKHSVGMSLMHSPHPSLVPLEMAAAGLSTVTTTYENKTEDAMRMISSNLIAVPPTVDGLVSGLKEAIGRIEQHERRLAGTHVDWPTDWQQAFKESDIAMLLRYLDERAKPFAPHGVVGAA
ncbi:glycosyltransferase (plasmid) [Shinella sumterensis]|nr:glycosyltransferase [Shinella sumterensis]